jgi:hypothetical protein
LDRLGNKESVAHKGRRVQKETSVRQVVKVFLVWTALTVLSVLLARRARPVHPVRPAPLEPLVLRERPGPPDHLAARVNRANQAPRAIPDHLAYRARKAK